MLVNKYWLTSRATDVIRREPSFLALSRKASHFERLLNCTYYVLTRRIAAGFLSVANITVACGYCLIQSCTHLIQYFMQIFITILLNSLDFHVAILLAICDSSSMICKLFHRLVTYLIPTLRQHST